MSEKKHLNEEELRKVSGGAPEYQEGWEIHFTLTEQSYCSKCKKNVTVVAYKEAPWCTYCSICHKSMASLF